MKQTKKFIDGINLVSKKTIHYIMLFLLMVAVPMFVKAQTATVQGNLGNFDVINETGQDTHGFEIQIEGVTQNDLYYTGYGQRYGRGTVTPYATGVNIRWESPYDSVSHHYTLSTPQYTPGTPVSWNDCYQAGSRYSTSGCENFGQGMRSTTNIVNIKGYWLIEDPANPGTLIRYNPNVAIPFPNWTISPVTVVSTPPVVVAEVEAPEAPEAPELYGNAQWIKIYKVQLDHSVSENDLSTGNGIVPTDPTQVEVAWDVIQTQPPSNSNGNQTRSRKTNSGTIATTTRAIIRRYETYKFTGTYDAITHKALCADLTCTAPSAGELGDQIGGSNSAVNVLPDSVTVAKSGTGGGNIDSADKAISCGNKCASPYVAGTIVTLTAKANSGSTFAGWTGSCAGVITTTCTVNATGAVAVGAVFNTTQTGGGGGGGGGGTGGTSQFTLSIAKSGSGTIVSDLTGINCGNTCSAKYNSGTTVTLTATPATGWRFVNWTGDCAGVTTATCTVTMSGNKKPQANFSNR